jgi:hypothetical protein
LFTLEMKTVLAGNGIVCAVCLLVLAQLWYHNRRKYGGLDLWFMGLLLQFGGGFLVALRNSIPDWASIVAGNTLVLSGMVVLYFGLLRFSERRSPLPVKAGIVAGLAAFVLIQTYFTFVYDGLVARVYNFSIGLALASLPGLWLVWRGTIGEMRNATKGMAVSFGLIVGICLARVVGSAALGEGNGDYMRSGPFDSLMVALFSGGVAFFVFNLVLMVNRRLFADARILSGLLPICAWCKKVRNDAGYWQDVEAYISARTPAEFTHGICPDCTRKLEESIGGKNA